MTKLEEKLKELGYEKDVRFMCYRFICYRKKINEHAEIIIDILNGKIGDYWILDVKAFKSQQDIDNLQQAFNIMQKDLEELKNAKIRIKVN